VSERSSAGFLTFSYVVALRLLGAARTGAYFSTAPFLGAVAAIVALGETLTLGLLVAGGPMGLGIWVVGSFEWARGINPVSHPFGSTASSPLSMRRRDPDRPSRPRRGQPQYPPAR